MDMDSVACVCICVNLGRTTAGNKEEGKTRFPIMKENSTTAKCTGQKRTKERKKEQKKKLKQNEESLLCCHGYLALFNDPLFSWHWLWGGGNRYRCYCTEFQIGLIENVI